MARNFPSRLGLHLFLETLRNFLACCDVRPYPPRCAPAYRARRRAEVSTFVPLLDTGQAQRLPAGAREVVEYRKSGLSLNHIQGCPLDCAYCIRHTYGLWDQRQPPWLRERHFQHRGGCVRPDAAAGADQCAGPA